MAVNGIELNVLEFAITSIAVVLSIIGTSIAVYNLKYYEKTIRKNVIVFITSIIIFTVAQVVHSMHSLTAAATYDFIAHMIEMLGFLVMSISSLVALKVRKEFGYGFVVLGLTVSTTEVAAHTASLIFGVVSVILSFYVWTGFHKDDPWSSIYFKSLLFRVLMVTGISFSLVNHWTGIEEQNLAASTFYLLGFVLIFFASLELKKLTGRFAVAEKFIKKQNK